MMDCVKSLRDGSTEEQSSPGAVEILSVFSRGEMWCLLRFQLAGLATRDHQIVEKDESEDMNEGRDDSNQLYDYKSFWFYG